MDQFVDGQKNGKVHLNTMDAGRRCGKVELIYESKYNGIKNVVIQLDSGITFAKQSQNLYLIEKECQEAIWKKYREVIPQYKASMVRTAVKKYTSC